MNRYSIDSRDYPGDAKCTVALSADTKEELLESVVQHGTKVHGYEETSEFREQIVKELERNAPFLMSEHLTRFERQPWRGVFS